MNLITNLKSWFLPWNTTHKDNTTNETTNTTGTTTAASAASTYEQLFADLQHVCTRLPGGEVFIVMGGGEFSVRMTWTPDDRAKGEQKRMFSLNSGNEIIEWVDAQPDEAAEARILAMEQPPVIEENTVKDAAKDAPQEEAAVPPTRKALAPATDDATPDALPETALCLPLQPADGTHGVRPHKYRSNERSAPPYLYTRGQPHVERHRPRRH